MLKGGCYCGAVRYESTGKVLRWINCHCPDCRKLSGASFASVLVVEASGIGETMRSLQAYRQLPVFSCGWQLSGIIPAQASPALEILPAGPGIQAFNQQLQSQNAGCRPCRHVQHGSLDQNGLRLQLTGQLRGQRQLGPPG